jgi:hypothetical protein
MANEKNDVTPPLTFLAQLRNVTNAITDEAFLDEEASTVDSSDNTFARQAEAEAIKASYAADFESLKPSTSAGSFRSSTSVPQGRSASHSESRSSGLPPWFPRPRPNPSRKDDE